MTPPRLTAAEGSSPAFSVHLFTFDPVFWREKIVLVYFIHRYMPVVEIPIRVDEPLSPDLGIALLSNDGDNLSAIGLDVWSRSEQPGKWRVRLCSIFSLPPISLAATGLPRAMVEDKLVRLDDACDAGTRDIVASMWPTLKQALTHQGGEWSDAIGHVEHSLLCTAVGRGDAELVTELLDQGIAVNTDLTRTAELLMGDHRKVRMVTVTRPRENALDKAARLGHCDALDVLLVRGARADATALGYAIAYRHEDIVERLLDHGADPNGLIWVRMEMTCPEDLDWQETVYRQVPAMALAHEGYRMDHFGSLLVAHGGDPHLDEVLRNLPRLSPA